MSAPKHLGPRGSWVWNQCNRYFNNEPDQPALILVHPEFWIGLNLEVCVGMPHPITFDHDPPRYRIFGILAEQEPGVHAIKILNRDEVEARAATHAAQKWRRP